MLPALVLALAAAGPSCWDVFDATLAHSAKVPHPAYVQYDQNITIWRDNKALISTDQHIRYDDDGQARIEDARFHYQPVWTSLVEPGPPELGPYGKDRSIWIPVSDRVPVIASTRAAGKVSCTMREETYNGRDTYHLSFQGSHLTELWVDTHTQDVWKIEMDAPGYISNQFDPNPQAHYEIHLGYHGGYLVVEHVTWNSSLREQSQTSELTGEYQLTNFQFPPQ